MSLHDIALSVALGVGFALIVIAWLQHRRLCACDADRARLNKVLTRVAKLQLKLEGRVNAVGAELNGVQQRQALLDARPNGGHRIESAVRVARQGAANETLLRELGLSDAEASLLLRMHGMSADAAAPAVTPSEASQARDLAQHLRQRTERAATG